MPCVSAIQHAGETFLSAVNSHHPSAIAECFVTDGQILPAYCHAIHGREAIAAFWQGIFALETMVMVRRALEIQVHMEWAYETGQYQFLGKDERLLDQGSYLVIWQCVDQSWKRYREIWNSSPLD